jgi:hypothetical protein
VRLRVGSLAGCVHAGCCGRVRAEFSKDDRRDGPKIFGAPTTGMAASASSLESLCLSGGRVPRLRRVISPFSHAGGVDAAGLAPLKLRRLRKP